LGRAKIENERGSCISAKKKRGEKLEVNFKNISLKGERLGKNPVIKNLDAISH
jgi:hypothetical protein